MKKTLIFLLLFLFTLLVKGQDTIVYYHDLPHQNFPLYDFYYNEENHKLTSTPDGGVLVYFSTYKSSIGVYTFIVKTNNCGEIEWVRKMQEEGMTSNVFFRNAIVSEFKNTVIMIGYFLRGNIDTDIGEKIFEISLETGEIVKSWTYSQEVYPGVLDSKKIGDNYYFTSPALKSFAKTDTSFNEILYCEVIDTVLYEFFNDVSFYLREKNAVYIHTGEFINENEIKDISLLIFDLSCNKIWEKRIRDVTSSNFLVSNDSIFVYFRWNGDYWINVFDMKGNLMFEDNGLKYRFPYDYILDIDLVKLDYKVIRSKSQKKYLTTISFYGDILEEILIDFPIRNVIGMYESDTLNYIFLSKSEYFTYPERLDSLRLGKLIYNQSNNSLEIEKCINFTDDIRDTDALKMSPYKCFPNPTSHSIYITSTNNEKPIEKLEIISLTGKTLYVYNDLFCEKRVAVCNFEPGIYILFVTIEGKVYTEKIIVVGRN